MAPKSKMIALGSDSINFLPKGEFDYIEDVNLFLDLLDEVVENYSKEKNIISDSWMWTLSDELADIIKIEMEVDNLNILEKEFDYIFLADIKQEYRKNLIKYLQENNKKIYYGGNHMNQDFSGLFKSYKKSKFTLGSTSPSWTSGRTMKGFRDWIGPLLGSLLIYDDHPDILRKYYEAPTYKYEKFESILTLTDILERNKILYQKILLDQQKWALENTIDKQLEIILKKYFDVDNLNHRKLKTPPKL